MASMSTDISSDEMRTEDTVGQNIDHTAASSSVSIEAQEQRPPSSFRPSPSPSITSQSDDPDREEDDEVDLDDDEEDYTDVGPSNFHLKDRRNTLKARGSAALVPKYSTSQNWEISPASAQNASAATLPHEILLHIFKYVAINPPDLRRSLTVCKAWCLCGVELLWHRPSIHKISSLFKLIHIIRRPDQTFPYANFIRRLNLSVLNSDLEDSLFSRMAVCNRLERLTLSQCTNISDDTIAAVLQNAKHLVAADFTDVVQLTDKTVNTIAENCPRLQGINLTGCKNITSASVALLAKNCKLLRRVKLCGCELVGDEALSALAEHCPVLLEVDLINCNKISDASVRKIWQYSFHMRELRLAQCETLTDLAFPAPSSSLQSNAEGGITHIPIPQHGALTSISQGLIRGSDSAPTSRGASPMGNSHGVVQSRPLNFSTSHDTLPRAELPMHTHLRPSRMFDHLRILDLTNCSAISDASIEGIVSNVPRIRNLILAKCTRLTNESAYSISRLGKNLHYLHLGHVSNLTDRAVCHLARSCTRLRYIDLACCPQLTDLSVLELATNLPKLRRIGLVRVSNLTDQAIYGLVERYTSLERIHLSYCENISVPAIFWLLERLNRLTHLSLTGVNAFRNPELQSMCREPPREFNAHQRNAFCVYSGKGVNELRKFLQGVYADPDHQRAAQFGPLSPDVHNAITRLAESRERRLARQQYHLQQQQQQQQQSQTPQSQQWQPGQISDRTEEIGQMAEQRIPINYVQRHQGMNLDQAMAAQQMPSFNMLSSISEPIGYTSRASVRASHTNDEQNIAFGNSTAMAYPRVDAPSTSYVATVSANSNQDSNTIDDDDDDDDDDEKMYDGETTLSRTDVRGGDTSMIGGQGSSNNVEHNQIMSAPNSAPSATGGNVFSFRSLAGQQQRPNENMYAGQGQTLGGAPSTNFGSRFGGTPLQTTNLMGQSTPARPGQTSAGLAALATPPLSAISNTGGNSQDENHPFAPGRFDPGQMTPIATINPFERFTPASNVQRPNQQNP